LFYIGPLKIITWYVYLSGISCIT